MTNILIFYKRLIEIYLSISNHVISKKELSESDIENDNSNQKDNLSEHEMVDVTEQIKSSYNIDFEFCDVDEEIAFINSELLKLDIVDDETQNADSQSRSEQNDQLDKDERNHNKSNPDQNLFSELDIDQFDLDNKQPIKDLEIELGSSRLPRISCACHKINLAVRTAMIKQNQICEILFALNKFINHVKRSFSLNKIFVRLKCRLRLENATRWGSAFLVFESIKKAHNKKAFEESEKLPVPIEIIDVYLKILKPAYIFNVALQSTESNIGDVLPGILKLINFWNSLTLPDYGKTLCDNLVDQFKQRFRYESESKLYLVNLNLFHLNYQLQLLKINLNNYFSSHKEFSFKQF